MTVDEENEIKEGLLAISRAIHMLGNADASTPMGGLEALGAVILESNEAIAGAIEDLVAAIREVATAIAAHR